MAYIIRHQSLCLRHSSRFRRYGWQASYGVAFERYLKTSSGRAFANKRLRQADSP